MFCISSRQLQLVSYHYIRLSRIQGNYSVYQTQKNYPTVSMTGACYCLELNILDYFDVLRSNILCLEVCTSEEESS